MYHGDNVGKASYSDGVQPFCVGHEFAGEIVEVGKQVHRFRVGDKVLASGGAPCGECSDCLSGHAQLCSGWTAFGISTGLNGGQAEYVNVPMADLTLQPIPEGISAEQSILLTDAMCTAYFGLTRTGLLPGESVAVVGLGPIGLIGVELAFVLGAPAPASPAAATAAPPAEPELLEPLEALAAVEEARVRDRAVGSRRRASPSGARRPTTRLDGSTETLAPVRAPVSRARF